MYGAVNCTSLRFQTIKDAPFMTILDAFLRADNFATWNLDWMMDRWATLDLLIFAIILKDK